MERIFLLTAGQYSDQHVVGAFSSRENAEEFKRSYPDSRDCSYNELEEMRLDPGIAESRSGLRRWFVAMKRSGDVLSADLSRYLEIPDDATSSWCVTFDGSYEFRHFRMWARDREHAIKIANERRIASLAAGE